MPKRFLKWLREHYYVTVNSIAFYPAFIAAGFLLLSVIMLELDFSELGKNFKARWNLISLKDAETARTITATIAGGIVSLTVFSFSMVMILLNQAASNMTNRMLDSLIGNRFQQVVLGFYIGTIVYALFLLSTIRDINTGIYVPALSIYLLILLTIVDIFMFIYFLHYVTQSVKYETIIHKIHKQTSRSLEASCIYHAPNTQEAVTGESGLAVTVNTTISGYYQGFNTKELLELCRKEDIRLEFLHPIGTYLLKNVPLLLLKDRTELSQSFANHVLMLVDMFNGQPVDREPYYGIRQLTEIAVKALSPGINDPGTAILSIHALGDLLAYRLEHSPAPTITDDEGNSRIELTHRSFDMLFTDSMTAIWDYGCADRHVQNAMHSLLLQLKEKSTREHTVVTELLTRVETAIDNKCNQGKHEPQPTY